MEDQNPDPTPDQTPCLFYSVADQQLEKTSLLKNFRNKYIKQSEQEIQKYSNKTLTAFT